MGGYLSWRGGTIARAGDSPTRLGGRRVSGMWFYPLLIVLVVLGIAGGVLLGGIFTIVLVPLAAIALVSAVIYALWGRSLQGAAGGSTDASAVSDRPLPHRRQRPSGRVRTSPERLVDA